MVDVEAFGWSGYCTASSKACCPAQLRHLCPTPPVGAVTVPDLAQVSSVTILSSYLCVVV
ncbi:predicted protein [Sclerotinia sclerotiorum 1980 UF-70]|uniref:Uncharacterized protein n=1 Tax=Sclerotinia sclerotiorum (strain ATCC 18683 / 1980 / Ss-1) TaxID=665079 RepID=A7EHN6_SCLS1|nr:predicted protein [Sclerotinia sclerotiorum 1980 UF-70]EDO02352.1 predicted protein [Sclerotinia sclerotiorum 1980 UF-70]